MQSLGRLTAVDAIALCGGMLGISIGNINESIRFAHRSGWDEWYLFGLLLNRFVCICLGIAIAFGAAKLVKTLWTRLRQQAP